MYTITLKKWIEDTLAKKVNRISSQKIIRVHEVVSEVMSEVVGENKVTGESKVICEEVSGVIGDLIVNENEIANKSEIVCEVMGNVVGVSE